MDLYAPADRFTAPSTDQEYVRVTNDTLETDEPDEGEPDREDTHLVSVFVSAARIATASESAS